MLLWRELKKKNPNNPTKPQSTHFGSETETVLEQNNVWKSVSELNSQFINLFSLLGLELCFSPISNGIFNTSWTEIKICRSTHILNMSYLGSVFPSLISVPKAAPKSKLFLSPSLVRVFPLPLAAAILLGQLWQL